MSKPVLATIEVWYQLGQHRAPGRGTLVKSFAWLLKSYEDSKGVRW